MPDPGTALHIASVDYQCTFSLLPPGGGPVQFAAPDPEHFTFTFETGTVPVDGQPGVMRVTWDYSWFDQEEVEAGIAAALNPIVSAVAAMVSVPLSVANAACQVRRVWTYKPNVQGAGLSSGAIVSSDYMTYPPLVSAADAATLTEAASAAQTGASAADSASLAEGAQVADQQDS